MVWDLTQLSGSTKLNGINMTKRQRTVKKKYHVEDNTDVCKKFSRQSAEEASPSSETCFFCGMPPISETFRLMFASNSVLSNSIECRNALMGVTITGAIRAELGA